MGSERSQQVGSQRLRDKKRVGQWNGDTACLDARLGLMQALGLMVWINITQTS